MNSKDIKHIISTGKLTGYNIGGGFLQVQWTSPNLEEGTLWLFKFTVVDNKLVSVENIKPSPFGFYGRPKAKRYVPMIDRLMSDLVNTIT